MERSGVLGNKNEFYSKTAGTNILDLLNKTFEIPEVFQGGLAVVDPEYIARPDLVALDAYGSDDYADIICKINGISNPFELNAGMMLLLPAVDELDNFLVAPARQWDESQLSKSSTAVPIPKFENQKRQPNEAVIGDSRYNIDETSQIVVY